MIMSSLPVLVQTKKACLKANIRRRYFIVADIGSTITLQCTDPDLR